MAVRGRKPTAIIVTVKAGVIHALIARILGVALTKTRTEDPMRNVGLGAFWATVALLALTSCSSRHRFEHDTEPDGSLNDAGPDGDANGDADGDSDADVGRDSDIEGPSDVPRCGDGVLDQEEECDDRNRLNGDGCDWLCRLGDGEPSPEPDPSFLPYDYGSAPVHVESRPEGMISLVIRLPLLWTGSELATAFLGQADGFGAREIFFHRYDAYGTMLDSEWEIQRSAGAGTLDLVWTGEGYTLFYKSGWEGVYMLRMSPTGKPISGPTLVVADPCALSPSADFAGAGHALAWSVRDYGDDDHPCFSEGRNHEVGAYLSLLADSSSGSSLAGPLRVHDEMVYQPEVAAGPGGFGVASDEDQLEEVRFFHVNEGMSEVVPSGILSRGVTPPSVVFGDGEYWVAWRHKDDVEHEDETADVDEICIARFSTEGVIIAAPVCSVPWGYGYFDVPRIAYGDGGLGLVVGNGEQLIFLRTDSAGVTVGEPLEVDVFPEHHGYYSNGPYAIVWAETAFVVLYGGDPNDQLSIRRFEESE